MLGCRLPSKLSGSVRGDHDRRDLGDRSILRFQARKKQVSSMLKTASGEKGAEVSISNLLMEPAEDARSFMERFIEGLDVAQKLQIQMQQAGLDWTPMKFLVMAVVLSVIGGIIGLRFPFMGYGITSVVLGLAFATLPYFYVRRARTKRLNKLEEQFPEALEFLARSMRAGHAFTISLEMLGEELPEPLGQEFRTLFNEQNLGAALEVALTNLCNRVPLLDMRFFSSSVLLQKQTRRQPRRNSLAPSGGNSRALPTERPGQSCQRTRPSHSDHSDAHAHFHHAGSSGGLARLSAGYGERSGRPVPDRLRHCGPDLGQLFHPAHHQN